jgi:hypothetical protein
MRNRNVGFLIIGISLIIGLIIFLFNKGLTDIVSTTCSHGPSCAMYETISLQSCLSLAIAGVVFIIGLFFIFVKENERIIVKKEKLKKKVIDFSKLEKRR